MVVPTANQTNDEPNATLMRAGLLKQVKHCRTESALNPGSPIIGLMPVNSKDKKSGSNINWSKLTTGPISLNAIVPPAKIALTPIETGRARATAIMNCRLNKPERS